MKKLNFLGGMLVAGLLLNACLDTDDGNTNQIPEEIGWLAFVNASPDSERLFFFANDKIINNEGLPYERLFGYIYQNTGALSLKVKTASSDFLDTININLQKGDMYSIYAINEFDDLKLKLYSDQHTLPDVEKSMLRFIQLSPDAPHLRLEIEGVSTNFGNFFYTDHSSFIEFDGGFNKKMYLIDEVTNDMILSKSANFHKGKSYSVFSKGFVNTTDADEQLDIQVIPFQ